MSHCMGVRNFLAKVDSLWLDCTKDSTLFIRVHLLAQAILFFFFFVFTLTMNMDHFTGTMVDIQSQCKDE